MMRIIKLSCVSSAILLSCFANAQNVSATLHFAQQIHSTDGDVHVELELTNHENKPVNLLKWATAEEGISGDLFTVKRDGKEVSYLGALYKRRAPNEKDYIEILPGQSINYKVELSALYDFSAPGQYEISYNAESVHLYRNADFQIATSKSIPRKVNELKSNTAVTWLDGEVQVFENDQLHTNSVFAATSYASCSNSQKSTINSAWSSAKTMSANATSYLTGRSTSQLENSARYTTWFGDPTVRVGFLWLTKAHERVEENFTATTDAIKNKPLSFDCSCTSSGTFAYVYPSQPYKIYFCGAFWGAPRTGTDSQAGTIIHEVSHFNAVAGTDDHAYGHSGAKQLASSDVKKAIENADSYEYFAENTPYQN